MAEVDNIQPNGSLGGLRALGAILSIIALIAGVASIVRPMQLQIEAHNKQMERVEHRFEERKKSLDRVLVLQVELVMLEKRLGERLDRKRAEIDEAKNRILKLEDGDYRDKEINARFEIFEGLVREILRQDLRCSHEATPAIRLPARVREER